MTGRKSFLVAHRFVDLFMITVGITVTLDPNEVFSTLIRYHSVFTIYVIFWFHRNGIAECVDMDAPLLLLGKHPEPLLKRGFVSRRLTSWWTFNLSLKFLRVYFVIPLMSDKVIKLNSWTICTLAFMSWMQNQLPGPGFFVWHLRVQLNFWFFLHLSDQLRSSIHDVY